MPLAPISKRSPAFLTLASPKVLALYVLLATSNLLWCTGTLAATDKAYHLRPQTHLKISVVEWVAATGDYKEWTALNGEYEVSPTDVISIPLIGEIAVGNYTTEELGQRISTLLKDKTGLVSAPTVSVEVVKYPMLYVMGAVDHPGAVEYQPGMTVMQAVAMAGGRQRKSNPTDYSVFEQIRYVGQLNQYELTLKQLEARRARLQAELNDSPTINVPAELSAETDSEAKLIMNGENSLFAARAETLKQQLASLTALRTLLQNEIKVLDEKSAVQDRQIKIARDELSSISSLVNSGTIAKTREISLERVVADLNSGKLDLIIASMRAKQGVSEAEREAENLKGKRMTEVGHDLQQVEADIEDTKLKRNTTIQLLQATGASLSQYALQKAIELQPVEYWLTRKGDTLSPIEVQQTATLEPGDVLDIRYKISPHALEPAELLTSLDPIQKIPNKHE